MAKSSRSSAIKGNNQRLKKNVFGPVESARAERLSAKLLEIAAQPKPQKDVEMEVVSEGNVLSQTMRWLSRELIPCPDPVVEVKDGASAEKEETMEVDSGAKPTAKASHGKKRIEKRRGKKSSIVFPKYGERKSIRKKK
ncbi:hypothetical protein B0T14DRAFT_515650 [Immersiella caudata]|uniref:DUF2423 domain-containing protein n=1 Tax=Immersiella caudata TaxID=314043 RepID=A0AA40C2R7_9PEZI|nr:hypothetical protein B0T14DRAFT_515650 [Immersiella caudata]